MVSQDTNVDSDGFAIDLLGDRLEGPPLAAGPLLPNNREFTADFLTHEESNPLAAPTDLLLGGSSSGSALGEHDLNVDNNSVSSGSTLSPRAAVAAANTSNLFRAAFQINANERSSMIAASKRALDLQAFIAHKGYSMSEVAEFLQVAGGESPQFSPVRDDSGLPALQSTHNVAFSGYDGLKKQIHGILPVERLANKPMGLEPIDVPDGGLPSSSTSHLRNLLNLVLGKGYSLGDIKNFIMEEDKISSDPQINANIKTSPVHPNPILGEGVSWSKVVQSDSNNIKDAKIAFDYCPMPAGSNIISPPDEILRKGIEKFKLCLVGTFSKGTLAFSKVLEIAHRCWDAKGLCTISQKNSHQFLFSFASESQMNDILAKGTWYFEQKPMIITQWGSSAKPNAIKSIPLWVKISQIPDYYWTKEGISFIASAVGRPLGADQLTSKLNPLPFAKICVTYNVGDPLPDSIPISCIDPASGEKSASEVLFSYPQKPLICSGCSALGHLVGACPSVKRVWVKKPPEPHYASNVVDHEKSANASITRQITTENGASATTNTDAHENWTVVKRKGTAATSPDSSPSPSLAFKGLKHVDEIDTKHNPPAIPNYSHASGPILSKSQRKKLKRSLGNASPVQNS